MAETAVERSRIHRGMAISTRCSLRIKTDMVPCRDLIRIRIVRVIVTTRTVHQGGIRPGVTHRAITAGCQSRIMVHFQATVQDRLAGMTGGTGDVGHVNRRVAIGTCPCRACCRGMVHRPLAVQHRLIGVTCRAVQLGLVNVMTCCAVVSPGRLGGMVTTTEEIRIAAGVTVVALIRCHQCVEIQHIVTGRTVIYSVIRSTIYCAVVHRRVAGQGLGGVTGRTIQGIAADPVNAFMTGRTAVVGVGRCCMVTRSLLAGCAAVAQLTVVNSDRCRTRMTIRTGSRSLGERAVMVTLGNRRQARIGRIDVTTGAVQSNHVLVTGGTVGICTRRGVVHGRRAVEPGKRGLRSVTGCTVK